jgi:hypothetical protein
MEANEKRMYLVYAAKALRAWIPWQRFKVRTVNDRPGRRTANAMHKNATKIFGVFQQKRASITAD